MNLHFISGLYKYIADNVVLLSYSWPCSPWRSHISFHTSGSLLKKWKTKLNILNKMQIAICWRLRVWLEVFLRCEVMVRWPNQTHNLVITEVKLVSCNQLWLRAAAILAALASQIKCSIKVFFSLQPDKLHHTEHNYNGGSFPI